MTSMDTIPSWFCSKTCPCCASLRMVFGSQIWVEPSGCLVTTAMLQVSNVWLAAKAGREHGIQRQSPRIARLNGLAIFLARAARDWFSVMVMVINPPPTRRVFAQSGLDGSKIAFEPRISQCRQAHLSALRRSSAKIFIRSAFAEPERMVDL